MMETQERIDREREREIGGEKVEKGREGGRKKVEKIVKLKRIARGR